MTSLLIMNILNPRTPSEKFANYGLRAAAGLGYYVYNNRNRIKRFGQAAMIKDVYDQGQQRISKMRYVTLSFENIMPPYPSPPRTPARYRALRSVKKRLFKTKSKSRPGRYTGNKGASASASKGYFNKTLKKNTKIDKYILKGAVSTVETGGLVTDRRNVTWLGHSTMPAFYALQTAWAAIIKTLLARKGLRVKNWTDQILPTTGSPNGYRVTVYVKMLDGDAPLPYIVDLTVTSTLLTMANGFIANFAPITGTPVIPQQFISIHLAKYDGTYTDDVSMDMNGLMINLFGKSHYRIQNRTVNTSSNDQSNDVDNVPVEGKSYDFKSNGGLFKDYSEGGISTSPGLTCAAAQGVFPIPGRSADPSADQTTMYDDVPSAKLLVGVKKVMALHLDPGDIKTSVLYSNEYMAFNKLYSVLYNRGLTSVSENKRTWLGKSRFFAFEKMIDAIVVDSDEKAFKLAYEHNVQVGCIATFKMAKTTAPRVIINKGNS